MKTTANLGLRKPEGTDVVDVADFNANADILDTEIAKKATTTVDGRMSKEDKAKLDAATSGTTASTLLIRDSGGRAKVAAPSASDDIARKDTVDAVQTNLNSHGVLTNTAHGATSAATASALIARDASGRAKVAAPSASDDIARKDTVDAVQTNLSSHTSLTGTAHGATSAATASTLIARDASGRAKVAAPSASDDIARKDTVDAVQTNLSSHTSLTGTAHGATSAATASTLVARDASGRAKVAAPSASDDIARKDTVDNAYNQMKEEIFDFGYNMYNVLVQNTYDNKSVPYKRLMYDALTTNTAITTSLSAQANSGQPTVSVASVTGFAIGQTVEVSKGNAIEEKVIQSISGNNINFTTNLANTYYAGNIIARTSGTISNKSWKFNSSRQDTNGAIGSYTSISFIASNSGIGHQIQAPLGIAIEKITVRIGKVTGDYTYPTDGLICELRAAQSGPVLASTYLSSSEVPYWSGSDTTTANFVFSTPWVTTQTTFWVVIKRAGARVNNDDGYAIYCVNSAGPTPYSINASDVWTSISGGKYFSIQAYGDSGCWSNKTMRSNQLTFDRGVSIIRLWLTRSNISGVTFTPKVSVIDSGNETWQNMAMIFSINNGDGTYEDTYAWTGTNGSKVSLKVDMIRSNLTQDPYVKKWGLAVGI